jgi:hypothetical protein
MKITDTVGRTMLVDLVYKDGSRWLLAPQHKLKGRSVNYVQVPHGEFAIKIESITGAELRVYQDGKELVSTTVLPRRQYVVADKDGRAFTFREEGDTKAGAFVGDVVQNGTLILGLTDATAESTQSGSGEVVAAAPQAPKGHNLVYVVVRFPKQNSPYGEPPQEEFEVAFRMMESETADKHFAENLHRVEQAPKLPNSLNPFSCEAPKAEELANRPSRHCVFCNRTH